MLFDQTLLFFHAGNVYNFTAGEYVSLVGVTSSCTSTTINLGNARDLGIGPGSDIPQIQLTVGTAFTASSSGILINTQFQGSTNSVLWTTYAETGYNSTASYIAGASILPIDVPRRPTGVGLPLYYQINIAVVGPALAATVSGLSTGTLIGGIVIGTAQSTDTLNQYAAGFTVS